ncbi:MAG: hypothetical protein R3C45_15910 [Phycisphaerales bacterium]
MHSLPLTLAAWDDWIWLALVGATVIGSWISNMKKKGEAQRKRDESPASMELEEMAARRREQLRQASRGRAHLSQSGGQTGVNSVTPGGGGEPGNLTMAERIARARAKAQYEQRARGSTPSRQPRPQVPNETQQRALAQRQAELERRQQAAQAQAQARQRAQQQAQQRARLQAQQQRAQAQAQAHARAQAQARQRGTLMHDHVEGPALTESTTRRVVPDTGTPKRAPIQPVTRPAASRLLTTASLSREDLRRAIVLNEVLGKPVGLRDEAGYSF